MHFYIKQIYFWIKGKNPIYEIFLREKKTLDMGCGEGKLLKEDKANIIGIDLNERMIDTLKTQGYSVFLEGVFDTHFKDAQFDRIVSDNVIEHLFPEEAHKMFIEMKRLLKKNGLILLKTPLPKIVWNSFGHVKPYTPMSIKKLFRDASREKFDSIHGLEIVGVYYYGFYSRIKFLFFIYSLLAIVIPFFRISYLIIIKKND